MVGDEFLLVRFEVMVDDIGLGGHAGGDQVKYLAQSMGGEIGCVPG